MDAFYASVEQRDRPELKGKAVVVGGHPHGRGVVATCSYEARKFGIHSAMPCARAYKLCPEAIFLKPRFDVYKRVSREIREIFYEYTDLVEPLSLDEAFLDVTVNKKQMASATWIAWAIRKKIYEKTGFLTASAGVSFNKFLAKVASDFNKPNGITVVPPHQAEAFIDNLSIRKFYGVGKVTEKKMRNLGIKTGADLKRIEKERLVSLFGKAGKYFYDISHGNDTRPVQAHRIRKSIGKETTLREDIDEIYQIMDILEAIAVELEDDLKKHDIRGTTLTLKVKYFDFQSITRSLTAQDPIKEAREMMNHVRSLLNKTEAGRKKVRLLGISISNFAGNGNKEGRYKQLLLPLFNLLCIFCLSFI